MDFTGGKFSLFSLLCIFIVAFLQPPSAQSYRIDSLTELLRKPSDTEDSSFKCAQSCSSDSKQVIEYQSGQTYTYKVDMSTSLNYDVDDKTRYNQEQSPQPTKVQINAIVDLSIYQPCEMVLRIRQVQIDGVEDDQVNVMKAQLERQSTHFVTENGQIGDVCSEYNEPEWTINIKKSILSAIQMSAKSIEEKSSVLETDINGQCQTDYEPINEWKYGSSDKTTTVIAKTKQLSKCNKRHQINLGLFPRSYGLDQLIRSSMPMINATYECRQKIQDGIVIDVQCCDKQNIWPLNVVIDSDIRAQLIDQQQGLMVPKSKGQLRRQNLGWMDSYKQQNSINGMQTSRSSYSVQDVEQLLQQICSHVRDSVQIQVPEMFAELIKAKQFLSVTDEQQLYESIQTGSLCQSPKIVDIYLDASAMSGTEGSVEILIQAYRKHRDQQLPILSKFSYLFSLLAFTKTPTLEAAQRLVQFVQEQQQIQQQEQRDLNQIVFGVSGFIHNLRQHIRDQDQHQNLVSIRDVETLVQTFQQQLVQQLEQHVQLIPNVNITTLLTLVHSLENIGLELPYNYQQQQIILSKMIHLVEQIKGNQDYIPVRVAIVRSLVDVVDDLTKEHLLRKIFMNEQEPIVIRIEAYRTLVLSGARISHLEVIKQYVDTVENKYKDLVNYVRSHQSNLRSTSDLYRRSILPIGAPEFHKPIFMNFGTSRNYELSYLNDVYQLGVTVETDVIFADRQNQRSSYNTPLVSIPQVLAFNLTIPVMGKEFQAVEICMYQTGLEQVLREKLQEYQTNKKIMDPITLFRYFIDVVFYQGEKLLQQNPHLQLLIQVGVDGKTIILFDQKDLISYLTQSRQIFKFFKNLLNNNQQVSFDRAFSFVPIDFIASMTTSNGLPVQVQINSSIILGLKTETNVNNVDDNKKSVVDFAIWPSFASQVNTRVHYYTGNQAKSIEHMTRVYSAPHVNLMVQSNDREVSLKWIMPESKYTLIRYESSFYINQRFQQYRSASLIDKSLKQNPYNQYRCTDFTKKPLGVAICYDVRYRNEPQQSQLIAEISMEKYDQQLNSFEIQLDNPLAYLKWITGQSDSNDIREYDSRSRNRNYQSKRSMKFVFNTPGSQIDREIAFELELPTFDNEYGLLKETRLRIQSPWKQIIAQAITRNKENERVVNLELTVDKNRYFQMEMKLEEVKQGQKVEYHPKVVLVSPLMRKPINLAGVWSYQMGRKHVLFVSLEDVEQKRHFIKATLVKNGHFNQGDLKSSVHCMVDLAGIAAKAIGTFERSERDLKLDVNTDYEILSKGRQSARLTFRHQNLSWGKMIKLVNQGSWSWTQMPKYDIEYNHQMVLRSNEYFEHDMQVKWNNEEQIRAYQIVNMVGQQGKYDIDSQAIMVFRPLEINYEVKARSNLVGFNVNGAKHYDLVATGYSRDDPEREKIRAKISYLQQSQPLKMKVDVTVKSKAIDFVYSDNVEEQQTSNYKGHMLIQLNPEHKYSIDYIYSIKNSESNEYNHQVNVTLNDEITKRIAGKHYGELRFIPNRLVDIQSKFTDEQDQNLFDGELKWDQNGASKCQWQHYPSDSKAKLDIDLYSNSMVGQMEFQKRDLRHSSMVKYDDKKSLKLNSKTKRNEENIFSIDSEISPEHESHLVIDSEPFATDCQYDVSSDDRKFAKIRFRLPRSWSHESQMSMNKNDGRYQVESHTDYQDKTVADINGKYHRGEKYYFRVKTPSVLTGFSADTKTKDFNKYDVQYESDKFQHQTKLDSQPKTIQFESKTLKDGKNLATIKYGFDEDKVHELKMDYDDLVKAKADYKLQSSEPYANFGLAWLADDSPFEHQTQIRANSRQQSVRLDSKTKIDDEKLAQIKAAIAKNPAEQKPYANVVVDLPQFEADVSYERPTYDEHQISWGFDGKTLKSDLKHRTQLKILKRSIVELKSESKSKIDKSNYLDVEGQYRHGDQERPSHFDVKLGQVISAIGKFNFFNKQEKSFDLTGKYRDNQGREYQHETKAKYWPSHESMKLDSKVGNKVEKNIVSVKSFLSKDTDKTSYFQMDSDDTQRIPRVKIELNPRMKRAAIDFDIDQYQHQTLLHDDNTALKVNAVTLRNKKNIYHVNTEINRNPSAKSHVKVHVGPKYQSEFHIYPEKLSGAFSLKTPVIQHATEFDLKNQMDQASKVQSITHYQNDLLADLDARMEGLQGENVIKVNVPSLIRLDTTVDVPGRRVSFDAQSDLLDHHAMGSIYASHILRNSNSNVEGRKFHFDLAWDVDRDPRSRVLVDVSAKRKTDQSMIIVSQMDYAHNRLIFSTELNPNNVLANSARVSLSYVPYGGIDSWQVIYTHMKRIPQVECKLEFLFRGQVKHSVRLTTQITDERFVVGFQTTSPQNIDAQINLNVIGVEQRQGQYYLKATLQRAVEDQYEIEATVHRDMDYPILYGNVELHFPKTEIQTIEYRIDLPGRRVFFYMVNTQTKKQLKINGEMREQLAELAIESDVPYFPIINGKIKYVPNREFYANLDVKNERLVEVQYKQNGFDLIESGKFQFLAKFQSIWTPSFEMTAQSSQQDNQGIIIIVEAKYNVEKIIYGQLKRMVDNYGKKLNTYVIEGWVSRPNGVKLLKTISKFMIKGEDQAKMIEYSLNIEPNQNELETIEPIYVMVIGQQEPDELHKVIGSIKVSYGHDKHDLIDIDLVVENIHPIVYNIPVPERIMATVLYVPTSTQATFQVSIMESLDEAVSRMYGQRLITLFDDQIIQPQLNNLRIVRKYRNQLMVSLDDIKIGYELISTQLALRNTWEHSLKLYSPQSNGRFIQYRLAYHYALETFTYFYRNELKSGYGQDEPIYQSTIMFAPILNKPTSYLAYYDIRSPILLGDGHVSGKAFFFGPENKYQGIVATLKTTQNDQVTFEATSRTEEQTDHSVYYGQINKVTYFNVSLYTQDKQIDVGFDGHVSRFGVQLNLHNQNRYGQQQTGVYRFQFIADDQFEVTVQHGNHGYQAKGKIHPKQDVWIADILVDKYEKVSGVQPGLIRHYYGRQVLQQQKQILEQYKIHVEAKDKCLRAEIEDQKEVQPNTQQLSLCMDMDQSNILNLAVDSIINGQKTTDLNIRLDTRQVSTSMILSLRWNPRYQRTLARSIQQITSSYDPNEIIHEMVHVARVLREKLGHDDQQINQYQVLVDQLIQMVENFGVDVNEVQQVLDQVVIRSVVYGVKTIMEYIHDYVSLVDHVQDSVLEMIQSIENQCYNIDTCRNSVKSIISMIRSPQRLVEIISDQVVQVLQHTHRIISTSYSGRLIRNLIPSFVMDYLPDFIHQFNHYFVQSYIKIIHGNYPLADFIQNMEHVLHEMVEATHWRQVQWYRVKQAVHTMVEMVLSPMRNTASTRVLVYDPHQGELQIELYLSAVQHPRYYQSKYNEILKPELSRHVKREYENVDGYNVIRKRRSYVPLLSSDKNSLQNKSHTDEPNGELSEELSQKRLKLNSAWVELMLARNQFDNYSIPFRIVTEELDHNEATILKSTKVGKQLQLLSLKVYQNVSLINVSLNINSKEIMEITFVDLTLQIGSDLRWTVKNSSKFEKAIDMIRTVGNTIQIHLHQEHLAVAEKAIQNLSLKFTWTPQRQSIFLETELSIDSNTTIQPDSINFLMQSYSHMEQDGPLMYGKTSMLFLIDDVFPEEPYFSGTNLSTLMKDGMNLRQSLCYHWLMYYHINHTLSERLTCHRVEDLCNLIAHFVHLKQLFRTPNQCLSCTLTNPDQETVQKVRFGSRRMVQIVDQAEVIFLLDGTCHKIGAPKSTIRFMLQLNRLSKVIERQFRLNQIRTKFMILTPNVHGQYEPIWPRAEPQLFFSHLVKFQFRNLKPKRFQNASSARDKTLFQESLWRPDGHHSLDFFYWYPYSPRRTSRHFIMIDCALPTPINNSQSSNKQSFTCQENDIDFNTARNILLLSNNYFHVITGIGLAQRSFSSLKMRRIIGLDWKEVTFDQQIAAATKTNISLSSNSSKAKNKTNNGQNNLGQWLRQHMITHRDICHILALETNGTIFNHRSLKQANRKIFAERLVANHQINECQRCDCTLAKDFLVAQQECFLCQQRNHTLLNPWNQRIRNQSFNHGSESDTTNIMNMIKNNGTNNSSSSIVIAAMDPNLNTEWPFNSPQEWTDDDEREFLEIEGRLSYNDEDKEQEFDEESS